MKNVGICFGILLLSASLLFFDLGKWDLLVWDETAYALVAKSMYYFGDYLVPSLNGHFWPWYGKPPLSNWLILVCYYLVGINNWSVRLPFALAGLATICIVFFVGKRIDGQETGLYASVFLSLIPGFVSYSRTALSDVLITPLFLISLVSYYLSTEKRNVIYTISSGAFMGLAVLTKQMVGFIPLLSIVMFELCRSVGRRQFALATARNICVVLLTGLLVSGWWYLYLYARFGNIFLSEYFGYHLFQRLTTPIESHGKNLFTPFEALFDMVFPLRQLIIIPLLFAAAKLHRQKLFSLVSMNAAIVFALFGVISRTFLPWYLIPTYPILAISVGFGLKELSVFLSNSLRARLTIFPRKSLVYLTIVVFFLPFYKVGLDTMVSDTQLVTERGFTNEIGRFASHINNSNVTLVYVEGEAIYQIDFYADMTRTVREWDAAKGSSDLSQDSYVVISHKSYGEHRDVFEVRLEGAFYLLVAPKSQSVHH